MREPTEKGQDLVVDRVLCTEVTGLDCDYVAEPDASSEWAERGKTSEQILAQLTSHVSAEHPGHDLSIDKINAIRDRITL